MTLTRISKVRIQDLTDIHKNQMLHLMEGYYRDPMTGLREELQCGNLVYWAESSDGLMGSFLIVNFDHDKSRINDQLYQFTYLGLGCATTCPIAPVFQQVKSDFSKIIARGTIGVLHLTTRTPFAYHGIEKAFTSDIFPNASEHQRSHAKEIASYIKASIHKHPSLSEAEDPFVLRQIKEGRFTDHEIGRIRSFKGETPISMFRIDCTGSDELIVFHTFKV
jgi:hypothetical protein